VTFDINMFRAQFPEFANKVLYPDTMLNTWATLASSLVSQALWKNTWQTGVSLYVAHELVMASQNVKTAAAGGATGTFGGVANNKGVGGATVGYDSQANSEKDAGYWNLTNYGKRFIRLARIFGAGCVQL
jgi:hypothetical protein